MDLETFIIQTLVSVRMATTKANAELEKLGKEKNAFHLGHTDKDKVEFDIAVTAEAQSTDKAGGGIKISVVNIGADLENKSKSSSASRIKFAIHLNYNMMG